MGRSPQSSDTNEVKKGPWTPEEDQKLREYIEKNGQGSWQLLPKKAGLNRCGKSCRLRWTNYLRSDIKRGNFTPQEEQTIIDLHALLGNKWSMIAARLPGRTDNEVKNYWNTHLRKKLLKDGIDPKTHQPITDHLSFLNINNMMMINPIENLAKIQLLCNIMQVLNTSPMPPAFSNQFDGLVLNNINPSQLQYSSSSPSSLVNPNLESSLNNLAMSGNYQHVLDTSEMMPGLQYSMNSTTISSTTDNTYKTENSSLPGLVPATPEITYGAQMIHASTNDNSMENINTHDEALLMVRSKNSSSCDNGPEMTPDDEASSSSFWKDILNDSLFPSSM